MWTDRVVRNSPAFDQHLRLRQCVEDLSAQESIVKRSIERLDIAVLPRTARCDEQGLHVNTIQPTADRFRRELRAVVRTDVIRHAASHEQNTQTLQHTLTSRPSSHTDRQTLATVLVKHRQQTRRSSVIRATMHEVVAPHVIPVCRAKANARPAVSAISAESADLPNATGIRSVYDSLSSPLREAFRYSDDTCSGRIEVPVQSSVVRHREYEAWIVAVPARGSPTVP